MPTRRPTRKEINAVEDKLKEYDYDDNYLKATNIQIKITEIFMSLGSDVNEHDIVDKTRELSKDLKMPISNHIHGMSSRIIEDCYQALKKCSAR